MKFCFVTAECAETHFGIGSSATGVAREQSRLVALFVWLGDRDLARSRRSPCCQVSKRALTVDPLQNHSGGAGILVLPAYSANSAVK